MGRGNPKLYLSVSGHPNDSFMPQPAFDSSALTDQYFYLIHWIKTTFSTFNCLIKIIIPKQNINEFFSTRHPLIILISRQNGSFPDPFNDMNYCESLPDVQPLSTLYLNEKFTNKFMCNILLHRDGEKFHLNLVLNTKFSFKANTDTFLKRFQISKLNHSILNV